MLIQKAIDHAINTKEFEVKAGKLGIELDACRGINVKLVADNEKEIHLYEMTFDFGKAGPSSHDINLTLRINDNGSFTLVEFQ